MITSTAPPHYELVDESANLADWLREGRAFPCACFTGELSDDDRQIYEAAYVAYHFGAAHYKKLAEQSTNEWQQSEFGRLGQEIESEIGINPFARRKRGNPVQQRDRLLIRAVAQVRIDKGWTVKLPNSDPYNDDRDTDTEFSLDCERFIRLIDPARGRMPGRRTYEAAVPRN